MPSPKAVKRPGESKAMEAHEARFDIAAESRRWRGGIRGSNSVIALLSRVLQGQYITWLPENAWLGSDDLRRTSRVLTSLDPSGPVVPVRNRYDTHPKPEESTYFWGTKLPFFG